MSHLKIQTIFEEESYEDSEAQYGQLQIFLSKRVVVMVYSWLTYHSFLVFDRGSARKGERE
jgi:hypothetical protein